MDKLQKTPNKQTLQNNYNDVKDDFSFRQFLLTLIVNAGNLRLISSSALRQLNRLILSFERRSNVLFKYFFCINLQLHIY